MPMTVQMAVIDDIMYIVKEDHHPDYIKNRLTEEFKKYDLELTFRQITTKKDNQELEFLDVLHRSDNLAKKKFIITDYQKPTAKNARFLHGKSFHPKHVYKGVIFGEGKRLCRLNETEDGYKNSLARLKSKCINSGFKKKIISESFEIIEKYKNQWIENSENKTNDKENNNQDMIPWTSNLQQIMHLNSKERSLIPNAKIVYSRPCTLKTILTNYRKIAHQEVNEEKNIVGISKKCNKCSTCGNFGKHKNMVTETGTITTKSGQIIKLKQNLNCKNFGIYAAQCLICEEIYVGQTINSFSKRWTGHRQIWKK